MRRASVFPLLALSLLACGGGDDGVEPEEKPDCSVGVALAGDSEATLSVNDGTVCGISVSFDSGLDVSFAPLGGEVSLVELALDDVTKGETGEGFPTRIGIVLEDGTRYGTSPAGCAATVTEHALVGVREGELWVEENYRVVGSATCSEPAVSAAAGSITPSEIAFRIPAIWGVAR